MNSLERRELLEALYIAGSKAIQHGESLEAAKRDAADGHRRETFAEGGSGQVPEVDGAGREIVVDGKKVMAPSPPHGDPTYSAVVARIEQTGAFSEGQRRIDKAFMDALKLFDSANGYSANVLAPPAEPPAPKREEICACCDNAVKATDSQREQRKKRWGAGHIHADLCDWCATFVVLHGRRPPKVLVQKHNEGKRIYDRDVRDALSA